nr:hypothetical protein [Pandoravirus massiliensis]
MPWFFRRAQRWQVIQQTTEFTVCAWLSHFMEKTWRPGGPIFDLCAERRKDLADVRQNDWQSAKRPTDQSTRICCKSRESKKREERPCGCSWGRLLPALPSP